MIVNISKARASNMKTERASVIYLLRFCGLVGCVLYKGVCVCLFVCLCILQGCVCVDCVQEVETDQFFHYFQPELKRVGYDGIFSPKSRARTMTEHERKHVDGCAIFYKREK